MDWFLIALGGAVGAPCRFVLDRRVTARARGVLPIGTIAINVLGSALLAIVLRSTAGAAGGSLVAAGLGTGFCGAFTTFSAYSWETFALLEDGHARAAIVNAVLGLGLPIGVAALVLFG